MAQEKEVALGCCAALFALTFWCLVVATGSQAVASFDGFNTYSAIGVGELTQVYNMGRDWDRNTFTDLQVIDGERPCPGGWDDAYDRVFYGIRLACDCLGKYSAKLQTKNQFVLGSGCDGNQTYYGCSSVKPFPPVYMHLLNNKRICGEANGAKYREASLPTLNDMDAPVCKDGYLPCIENSKDTFCYSQKDQSKEKHCPITDIQFTLKNETSKVESLEQKGYKKATFDDDYELLFSKAEPSRPMTGLKIGPQPCQTPYYQSHPSPRNFYAAEVMGGYSCKYDTRYTDSGFETNEYQMQFENHIYNVLGSRSSYHYYVNDNIKEQTQFRSWNRPTWQWDLKCEEEGKTRAEAYRKTQLSLNSSGHEVHVAGCGMALVILFPCLCCCSIAACFFGPAVLVVEGVLYLLIWVITGPIMMTSLAEMEDALSKNVGTADEFVVFEECADPLARVDVATLKATNQMALDKVNTVMGLAIATFSLIGSVVVIPCFIAVLGICAVGCKSGAGCCADGISRIDNKLTLKHFQDFLYLMKNG